MLCVFIKTATVTVNNGYSYIYEDIKNITSERSLFMCAQCNNQYNECFKHVTCNILQKLIKEEPVN